MSRPRLATFFACLAAALLIATPAMGQLINFPVLALAPGGADGSMSVGAGFARGIGDDSGEQSSFGAGFVRGMEKISFGVSGGYVATDTDELTLAGKIAVHVLTDGSATVSVQSGLGWMAADPDITFLSIPIGLAIQGNSGGNIRPWVMPRAHITRISVIGVSSTETDFGASAGVSYSTEGGVAFGVAVDYLYDDAVKPFFFLVGVSYAIN